MFNSHCFKSGGRKSPPYFFYAGVFFLALFVSACDKQPQALVVSPQSSTVSGTLTVFLHRREVIGLYVRFQLMRQKDKNSPELLVQSAYSKISANPMPFSLVASSAEVNQAYTYFLSASVAEDVNGKSVLAKISRQVLTQGYPSRLALVISVLPTPIE